MSEHALLSASDAARWTRCYGAIAMTKDMPRTSSAYADEGTAAHTLGERCLREPYPAPHDFIGERIDAGDRTFEVTQDMADHVATYVKAVRDMAEGHELFVEERVHYHRPLGVPEGLAFGTSDTIIVAGDELIIVDLKYGQGVGVDAEDNPQLMLYALGAWEAYSLLYDIKQVRMVISQPRKGHFSEAVVTVPELKAFALEAAMAAQHALANLKRFEADPTVALELTPGEKQCRWCRAKATCPALRDEVKLAVGSAASLDDFDDVSDKPLAMQLAAKMPVTADLSAQALSQAMKAADLVEAWLKAVRAEVERRMLAGETIDGFKLVEGRQGNRAWSDPEAAEALLKSFRLKQEEMYSFNLISPTTAEKLLASSPKRWSKAEALVVRAAGGKHVAPLSDKRPAIDITPVVDAFDDETAGGLV